MTTTRWELVDGWNTGENANGVWKRSSDGEQVCYKYSHVISTETFGVYRGDWIYPRQFIIFNDRGSYLNASTPIGGGTDQSNFRRALSRITIYSNTSSSAIVRGCTVSGDFPNTSYQENDVYCFGLGRWYL